jgi:16S rRNA (adenine1518-N6/adenine1519-N6)-dimethyltransferase
MAGNKPNKSLGQHWLTDKSILKAIVEASGVESGTTVLEIGPGLGTLTAELLESGAIVTAVEFDHELAINLEKRLGNPKNLTVVEQDILEYNFTELPANYTVVANIPYYLTSKLIRVLSESTNPPITAVLLIQKEVAERVCAKPGQMSLLSISAQVFFEANLDIVVPAIFFDPPPKVDSQVLVLQRLAEPKVPTELQKDFFRLVKAGFSERRKKLRSSLSGGLGIDKNKSDKLLAKAKISPELRAQSLSIKDWENLTKVWLTDFKD